MKHLLLLLLGAVCLCNSSAFANGAPAIDFDGKEVCNGYDVRMQNDCTMIPYDTLASILDVNIEWDKMTGFISVNRYTGDSIRPVFTQFVMQVGANQIQNFSEETIYIEAPPFIENNILYVPLRAVCENLNAVVEWDEQEKTVKVSSHGMRNLLAGRFGIDLPSHALAGQSVTSMIFEDDTFNSSVIHYKTNDTRIYIYAGDLLIKTVGNIKQDASNLKHNPDNAMLYSDENIDILCERDLWEKGEGYALIRMPDDFLIELSINIHTDEKQKINLAADEIWNRIKTITPGNRMLNLSRHEAKISVPKISIPVPDGYMVYSTSAESGLYINVIMPVKSDSLPPTLLIGGYIYHTQINPVKTIEGQFHGKKIVWQIYEDGSAFAKGDQELYIENAAEDELNMLIDIAKNIKDI